jgi:hypothetical protein
MACPFECRQKQHGAVDLKSQLHPKGIVASSANLFMLRQLGVAHGPTTTEDTIS